MNNNQNTLALPESLIINEVQYQMGELFNNYKLPIHIWKLIMSNFVNQIEAAYAVQIKEDHKRYMDAIQNSQMTQDVNENDSVESEN